MAALFRGTIATLKRRAKPTRQVYRVIPGRVWWTLVHWPWRQYRAAVATGTAGVSPPTLAPPGVSGVYVTDRASLRGLDTPSQFAYRLSLNLQSQSECQVFGCAVIEFNLPQGFELMELPSLPGASKGLTGGGAREWLLAGNIALDDKMRVYLVEMTLSSPRHYRLPL